jgi:hypothetical protein
MQVVGLMRNIIDSWKLLGSSVKTGIKYTSI